MNPLKHKIKQKQEELSKNPHDLFKNETGAIDLASIMVGIIVIGLIGGVIASTIFVVIPWTQDNAAKHQLDSITSAESAYMGLSSTSPPSLPAGAKANSFGNSVELEAANLLKTGETYCVSTPADGKTYDAFSQSSSGAIWATSSRNSKPVIFTGTLPTDCQFITASITSPTPAPTPTVAPYVDPTPTLTTLTYNCATTTTGSIPMKTALTGKETWNGGTPVNYVNAASAATRTLTANVVYTVTFDGTYTAMDSSTTGLAACLRAVNHWGSNTGITNATNAFKSATTLTDVPANIPPTITNPTQMFWGATQINDPDISKWDISNFTTTYRLFWDAKTFNQPLNDWNMSNISSSIGTFGMFDGAIAFNQPLDKWNVSNITRMSVMFNGATAFNQDLSSWDVSNVTQMDAMFNGAKAFNQDLSSWKTLNVTTMNSMFYGATNFNGNVSNWDTSKVANMSYMFQNATNFNQNLSGWNTAQVTSMYQMFYGATNFNGDITGWNTIKVADMRSMMLNATAFNRDLHLWDTAALTLTYGTTFANSSFPTAYLPPKTAK